MQFLINLFICLFVFREIFVLFFVFLYIAWNEWPQSFGYVSQ